MLALGKGLLELVVLALAKGLLELVALALGKILFELVVSALGKILFELVELALGKVFSNFNDDRAVFFPSRRGRRSASVGRARSPPRANRIEQKRFLTELQDQVDGVQARTRY